MAAPYGPQIFAAGGPIGHVNEALWNLRCVLRARYPDCWLTVEHSWGDEAIRVELGRGELREVRVFFPSRSVSAEALVAKIFSVMDAAEHQLYHAALAAR